LMSSVTGMHTERAASSSCACVGIAAVEASGQLVNLRLMAGVKNTDSSRISAKDLCGG
jgi:hypothetical protein